MTPIQSIVIKDLRRLSGGLIVFAAILLLKWLVGLYMISGGKAPTTDTAQSLAFLQGVLVVLDVVLAGLLVAGLIHEDPAVGTDAQWMTRPIHPIQMLTAKMCGIFVILGVLPVAVTIPWWLLTGLTGSQIQHVILAALLANVGIALVALPFAVLTRTTGRFLVTTIGVLVGLQVLVGRVRVVELESGRIDQPSLSTGVAVLIFGILAITSLTVIVHQYLVRRTTRSIILGFTGLALAYILPSVAASNLSTTAKQEGESSDLARNVDISLERIERTTLRSPLHLRLVFKASGAPPGYALQWHGFGQQTLLWRNGREDASGAAVLDQSPTAKGVAALLTEATDEDSKSGVEQRFTTFLRIPSSAAALLENDRPRYTLDATFRLVAPRLIATGPATTGILLRRNGHTARVVENAKTGQVLEILTVETSPSRVPAEVFQGELYNSRRLGHQWLQLFLAGPAANAADSPSHSREISNTRQRIAGVNVLWRRTKFFLPETVPSADDTSLENDIILGAFYVDPVLTVKRTVIIDHLPVPMD